MLVFDLVFSSNSSKLINGQRQNFIFKYNNYNFYLDK